MYKSGCFELIYIGLAQYYRRWYKECHMTENTYQLPVMDTIESAWQKVKGSKSTFWKILGLIFLNAIIFGVLGGIIKATMGKLPGQVPVIIGGIVQLILSWGLVYVGIKRAADQPIQYKMFKYMFRWDLIFKMLGLYVLQVLIVVLTTVILIPALLITTDALWSQLVTAGVFLVWYVVLLFVLIRMFLGKALVIDKGLNPWAAIKMSFLVTKGNIWRIFGFLISCVLILLVSIIPLGLGLIWSLPFTLIAYGLAYKRLMSASLSNL
jgi:hypothetical protein